MRCKAHISQGPLSTALRMLPRLLQTLSPAALLSHIPFLSPNSTRKAVKISKSRKGRVERMLGLMTEAEEAGCEEVWWMRGRLRMVSCLGLQSRTSRQLCPFFM